jgi:DNA-binding NarL/FixJ family response regulator
VIRLLIAAASPILRAGLEALVASSPGLEVVGSFPDLTAVEDLRPDVVLAAVSQDQITPPPDGEPPCYVLLSSDSRSTWTHEALRDGVRSILPMDATPSRILAAVEAAANGFAAVDPHDLERWLSTVIAPAGAIGPLTARELDVLSLMAEGVANKTIAWRLGISEHTVKFHVASILTKLNAASRTEAVATGIRRGLILL